MGRTVRVAGAGGVAGFAGLQGAQAGAAKGSRQRGAWRWKMGGVSIARRGAEC